MEESRQKDALGRKLAALDKKGWFPPELLALVEAVCRLQDEARASLTVSVDPAQVRGDLEHRQGAPLLSREAFPVDAEGAGNLFMALLDVTESLPQLRTPSQLVRDRLVRGEIEPAALFRAYAAEDEAPFAEWEALAPDAPKLLPFLVYNAMEPWLEAAGAALAAAHPQSDVWPYGHCPICGSPAFIGHLSPPESSRNEGRDINKGGKRLHVCSYCRAAFRAKRLQCPFCLEEDQKKLDYFTVDSETGYQVHVCRTCKSYIKIADFRELFGRTFIPALDDLESLALDMAAQKEGFHRLAPSEWGL